MKHLAAMNIVAEKEADTYVSTAFSKALTEPKYRDGVTYWFFFLPFKVQICTRYEGTFLGLAERKRLRGTLQQLHEWLSSRKARLDGD